LAKCRGAVRKQDVMDEFEKVMVR